MLQVVNPLHERFDNNALAGWAVSFDVNAKDGMTYC